MKSSCTPVYDIGGELSCRNLLIIFGTPVHYQRLHIVFAAVAAICPAIKIPSITHGKKHKVGTKRSYYYRVDHGNYCAWLDREEDGATEATELMREDLTPAEDMLLVLRWLPVELRRTELPPLVDAIFVLNFDASRSVLVATYHAFRYFLLRPSTRNVVDVTKQQAR